MNLVRTLKKLRQYLRGKLGRVFTQNVSEDLHIFTFHVEDHSLSVRGWWEGGGREIDGDENKVTKIFMGK